MRRFLANKKVNIYGETMVFTIGYSKGILTISHLIEVLQSFRNNAELILNIKESLIAGGNQATLMKG